MGCVKSSVQVTVKWIKYKSPDQERVIKNGKGEIGCPLDGGNSIFYVKKRGFQGDGKFRRKPTSHNIVLTLLSTTWRRKTRFLLDVIVRERPTTTNVILAMLRGCGEGERDDSLRIK